MTATHPGTTAGELPCIRHNWTIEETLTVLEQPFNDLLMQAHCMHRRCHDPNKVQFSALLSVKTGHCPEDCAYCPQSAHYRTDVAAEKLLATAEVVAAAKLAQQAGAERFCIGAAWRQPTNRNLAKIAEMVQAVRQLGLETCATLGMLTKAQAQYLAECGLDYYNHNLDTSPEFYGTVITTRTYQDRLDTLQNVRRANLKICCGGILGMGESRVDRVGLLIQLANMPQHPESVPVNMLVQVKGTPLYRQVRQLDPVEFVRTIATARILMPRAQIRLSAGRRDMSDEMQALCFFAGANSVFYGATLLTTPNAGAERDTKLFNHLGINSSRQHGGVN